MQNIVDAIIFPFLNQEQQQEKLEQKRQQEKLNQELLQAVEDKKDLSIIKEIIKNKADVNCASKDGRTPLHRACANGHTETAKFLIENKADVNCVNKYDDTPLRFACQNGHNEIAKFLIENGADGDYADEENLNLACRNGHTEIAKFLIKNGANVNCLYNNGYTPLHLACHNGHTEIAKFLIENKANVNFPSNNGYTSLHLACENGHTEIAKFLIENKADVNCADKDGYTSLHLACENGHTEIAKFLIENKADVNCVSNNGATPLHYACQNGHTEIAKFLIKNGANVNCLYNNGYTPLHLACHNGHTEIAKFLIENKADVNCASKDGRTPLHLACLFDHTETAKFLIENKADVNCVNNYGSIPIQDAVRDNHIAVINILFELGADVSVLNQEFINKYNKEIKPETKNLIAKITQAENIKKRDEALKSKKDSLITSEVPAKIQPEITANTTTTETQEQLSTLGSKITEIQAQQEKLINSNQLQIKDLKSAIDHQLASTKQLASASSHNINPRFRIKPQDLQEIKYIQDNPELNDYYLRMQKSFNEAFLFATIVSHGGTTIEENSRIANNIEKLSEYVGDIPFASLIITQIKNTATAISKAKTIGKQANFSDIIFTADGIESSLFSERIARRFTISRELNDQLQHQITPNKSQIKDKSRMDKMKIYLKEQARKFGKKYLKLSQNLERGFLGQELSPTNQLALSDFEKAIEFIFNEGIDETIRKTRDETERHQAIIKEIIANSIALEIKELKEEKEVSETKDTKEYNIATQSSTKNSISSTSQTTQRENPTITTNSISEEIMSKMQAEIQALRERDEIREKEMQENQQKLSKLEEEIKRKDEEKRKEDEERKKSEEERKKRDEERERKIKEMYDNQQKLKKLTEIADIAPNIEITIGEGTEAQKVKLGKLMKEFEKNKSNDEKNLSDILHYIILQLEELGFRIGEVEDARPTNRVKKNKAVCFASKDCVIS